MNGIAQFRKLLPTNSTAIAMFSFMVPHWPQIELSLQKGNWAEARLLLYRWIQFNPNDGKAWYYLGEVNYYLMNFEEMIHCFQKAEKCSNRFQNEINKKKEISWSYLIAEGIRLDKENKEEEALQKFLLAVKIQPSRFISYRLAGEISYKIGNLLEAYQLFEKALQIQPDSGELQSKLEDIKTIISAD